MARRSTPRSGHRSGTTVRGVLLLLSLAEGILLPLPTYASEAASRTAYDTSASGRKCLAALATRVSVADLHDGCGDGCKRRTLAAVRVSLSTN